MIIKFFINIIICLMCQFKAAALLRGLRGTSPPPVPAPSEVVQRRPPVSPTSLEMIFDVDKLSLFYNPLNRAVQGLSSGNLEKSAESIIPVIVGSVSSLYQESRKKFGQNADYDHGEEDIFTFGAADDTLRGLSREDGLFMLTYPLGPLVRLSDEYDGPRETTTLNKNYMLFRPV